MTLLDTLRAFLESRPGFDPANYCGAPDAYRADYATAYRHLRDGRELLRAAEWAGITDDALAVELRSGRLTLDADGRLDYCTGQYYPTEYRGAVCSAVASVLWRHYRMDGDTGDTLRRRLHNVLGARLARRWFN